MAKARREIRQVMGDVDLVIEVLDARIPLSSQNPLIAELRGTKPTIRILNKSDLADPAVTAAWLDALNAEGGARALAHNTRQSGLLSTVTRLARELVPPVRVRAMAAMIVGVPNVGKSTVVNTLAGRSLAKAENRPAVTQKQQKIRLGPDLMLMDTPGFLWPKFSPPESGYRLALTGAIADRVLDPVEIGAFGVRFMAEFYPEPLRRVYGLSGLDAEPVALLEAIGRARGCIVKGGGVDLRRAAERFVQDLRAGVLGGVSLERPG